MINKAHFFVSGTVIAYLLLILIPTRWLSVLPFGLFFLSSLYYFSDLKKSLFVSSIFVLPFSLGKALFLIDNNSYFSATPFVGIILALSLLSLKEKFTFKSLFPDLFLIFFFCWGIVSFFVANTSEPVLGGIIKLAIVVLFYFLAKLYLHDQKVKNAVVFLLTAIVIFESVLTIVQYIISHPLGLIIEESINLYPFGRLSSEDITLFRPSGTFVEPTYLARFLTMLLPFLLLKLKTIFPIDTKVRIVMISLALFTIFITFTRVSWIVAFLVLSGFLFQKRNKLNFNFLTKPVITLVILLISVSALFRFLPLLDRRIALSSISFEEGGSFDTRVKLAQEAINLIEQYPLFGVGLNRFMPVAQENNITGFFQNYITNVHNVPLLIASEMGIPALIFFLGFVILGYKYFLVIRTNIKGIDEKNFKDMAALGGIAYLFESQMGTIFLTPHLTLFFLYMTIITS